MLTSLFGDLGPSRDGKKKPRDFDDTQPDSQGGFAATAIMESVATEVNERGQIIDRHVSDLVVIGSPAQAIGQEITLDGQLFTVIGTMEKRRQGISGGSNPEDNIAVMPVGSLTRLNPSPHRLPGMKPTSGKSSI